jgi:hypothetical protein
MCSVVRSAVRVCAPPPHPPPSAAVAHLIRAHYKGRYWEGVPSEGREQGGLFAATAAHGNYGARPSSKQHGAFTTPRNACYARYAHLISRPPCNRGHSARCFWGYQSSTVHAQLPPLHPPIALCACKNPGKPAATATAAALTHSITAPPEASHGRCKPHAALCLLPLPALPANARCCRELC